LYDIIERQHMCHLQLSTSVRSRVGRIGLEDCQSRLPLTTCDDERTHMKSQPNFEVKVRVANDKTRTIVEGRARFCRELIIIIRVR
jgi:hypothetical protein